MIKGDKQRASTKQRPKDGAQRQEDWRERERKKGRSRRFDRRVTEKEYRAIEDLLRRLRET